MLRAAKVMRLDSLWVVDHYLGWFPDGIWNEEFTWTAAGGGSPHRYFDWSTLLGYASERAGGVQLGVGVTEPIRHHPVRLAQTAMTLSHMTKRPPILGIGAGEAENTTPYGFDFSTPVGRLEEALQIIRLCFTSEGPFDFHGEHFRLDQALMDLHAKEGNEPQMWVAAHGPRMLRLTGRYGDGWYPTIPMSPEGYAGHLTTIRAAAADAGREAASIVPGLQAFFAVAPSAAEAEAALGSDPMRFFALLAPDSFWKARGFTHPLGSGFGGLVDFIPQRYEAAQIRSAMAAVPFRVLSDNVIWGTPAEVIGQLEELVAVGMRHVTLAPVSAMISRKHAIYAFRAARRITRALHRM
jgi:phthiodiolone/phenolphthiodiolone dimycocerosates ketoreductase